MMDSWSDNEQIRDFCRAWRKSGTIFFVLDQREALDTFPDDPDKDRKAQVRICLDELLSRNYVAYSASAESKTHRVRPGQRSNIKEFAMLTGFEEVCTNLIYIQLPCV